MNCAREDLTLGKDCEAVGESCYVVLWSLINSFQWFVALYLRPERAMVKIFSQNLKDVESFLLYSFLP